MRRLILTLVAVLTPAAAAYAQTPAPTTGATPPAATVHHRRPIVFEKNVGQLPKDTLFAAHAGDESLSIGRHGDVRLNGGTMGLAHARHVDVRGEQAESIRYLGRKRREVPAFTRIVLPGVLPGIDWVWRSNDDAIEFEFVVHPGANANAIALQFDRGSRLKIENGNLIVSAHGRQTVHHRPRAYQEIAGTRQTVSAAWRISGGHARFALGAYDRHAPLVIDPAIGARPPAAH
jgi:hypothetical protein